MVRDQQFVGHRLDILRKGRPRFLDVGSVALSELVALGLFGVTLPCEVLPVSDAGDRDGVDAVVYVVDACLFLVLRLQPPYLAEIGSRCTLDRIDAVKDRLQVESGVAADDADVDTLAVAESFRHLGHCEPVVLPAPVILL